jgi:hypothetical protein
VGALPGPLLQEEAQGPAQVRLGQRSRVPLRSREGKSMPHNYGPGKWLYFLYNVDYLKHYSFFLFYLLLKSLDIMDGKITKQTKYIQYELR